MFSHLLRAFRTAVKKCAVNLGGWLVLEPWTTPSLFDNTSITHSCLPPAPCSASLEATPALLTNGHLERFQSRATATAVLTNHWDTWITETDFAAIRAAGLNHVRLPIGYWAFKVGLGEPYIQGQLPYLKKAIDWATNYDLKLIIDLHGGPREPERFRQQVVCPILSRLNSVLMATAGIKFLIRDGTPTIRTFNAQKQSSRK